MRLGTADNLKVVLQGLGSSGRLNTAFIERVNLTVRHGVAALARRTWATAQQSPYLLAHLEWWRAYYHFVRPHQSLRIALVQPRERGGKLMAQRYRQRTPAMAAGRAHRRWNEVGGQRVTFRHVSNRPFPNRTGTFQRIRLSRDVTPPCIGLSRPPSHPLGCVHLPLRSFTLSWALPQAFDYYDRSVTMRVSPCR